MTGIIASSVVFDIVLYPLSGAYYLCRTSSMKNASTNRQAITEATSGHSSSTSRNRIWLLFNLQMWIILRPWRSKECNWKWLMTSFAENLSTNFQVELRFHFTTSSSMRYTGVTDVFDHAN